MKLLPSVISALLLSGGAIAQKLEVVPARVPIDEAFTRARRAIARKGKAAKRGA